MKYKLKPWDFQKEIIEHVIDKDLNARALFLDCGTGKTKISVDILRGKCIQNNRLFKTLIICPLVVVSNWKKEILANSGIKPEKIQLLDGITKPDGKVLKNPQKKLRLSQLDNKEAKIFIINTENVSNKDVWDKILDMSFNFLIVDESHRFKSYNGKRTKALHKLSRQGQCMFKYILTGSPILQSALDLWSQFYILNPKILGSNYFSFRAKYFYDKNANMPSHIHFPDFVPKNKAYFRKYGYKKDESLDGLNEVIYKYADRVMKDDVLDLPPRVYQTLEVSFTKEQKRIYNEMRDNLLAFLETGKDLLVSDVVPDIECLPPVMKADLAIVKTLRLQQLVCGIFTKDSGEIEEIPTNRIKVLEDLLEELSVNKLNKIIVWSIFTPTYDHIKRVCEKLNINYVMLTGQQSRTEKIDNVDAFNEDPNVTLMIANQGAGGTGVNLTAANYEIYYSRSFVLEHDLQADARAYRGGQKRKTTRIDLVTPDTMDSKIVVRLSEKRKHAEDILEVKSKELSRKEILNMV